MKHDSSPAFLYVNSLSKTTEYKLDRDDNLVINELSLSRHKQKVIPLETIKPVSPSVISSNLPELLIVLGSAAFATSLYLIEYEIAGVNFLSASFMLVSLLALSFIIIKPAKNYKYIDILSNKVLFTIKKNSPVNSTIDEFINLLDQKIVDTKNSNIISIDDIDNAKNQNSVYNEHLDVLYNSGMLDEVMYKRISNNISEKTFGENDFRPSANVIYLPLAR